MASLIGKTIAGFEIQEEIGRGAMGVVFKARQTSVDRTVALKFLPRKLAKDPKRVKRFLREARAAGRLSHSNMVAVHDVGEAEGIHYIAMEFIDGPSAQHRVKKKGTYSEKECIAIGRQMAAALHEAHRNNVLHRDVKPDNILIDQDNRACLADLGLAFFEDDDKENAHLTNEGMAMGTPHYMAPEQARGLKADARSDLYSMGSTLYFLATARTPFSGHSTTDVMVKVVTEKPTPLGEINPALTQGFVAIVEKLMEKKPEDRFQSAEALRKALENLESAATASQAPAVRTKSRKRTVGGRGDSKSATENKDPVTPKNVHSIQPFAKKDGDQDSPSPNIQGRATRKARVRGRAARSTGSTLIYAGGGIGLIAVMFIILPSSSGTGRKKSTQPPTSAAEPSAVPVQAKVASDGRRELVKGLASGNDHEDRLFEDLESQHEALLRSNPKRLAATWRSFNEQHPQHVKRDQAHKFLSQADAAVHVLEQFWKSTAQGIDQAIASDDLSAAARKLNEFILAHEGTQETEQAMAKRNEIAKLSADWAGHKIGLARSAINERNFSEARKILQDVKDTLAALERPLDPEDLTRAFAELNKLESESQIQEQAAYDKDSQQLSEALGNARTAITGDQPGFRFDDAALYLSRAAKRMKSTRGGTQAQIWQDRFERVAALWESAIRADLQSNTVTISDLVPGKQVRISGLDRDTICYDPPDLPPGQKRALHKLTPSQATQLVSWQIKSDAEPNHKLDLGLFAYLVGDWATASRLLESLAKTGSKFSTLADEPWRESAEANRKDLEGQALDALGRAKGFREQDNRTGAHNALRPFRKEGGELIGTAVARERVDEIQAIESWAAEEDKVTIAGLVTEKKAIEEPQPKQEADQPKPNPDIPAARKDPPKALTAAGWLIDGSVVAEGDSKTRFKFENAKITLPSLDYDAYLKFAIEGDAMIAVYFRYQKDSYDRLLEIVKTWGPMAEKARELIGPGYGVVASSGKLKLFMAGDLVKALEIPDAARSGMGRSVRRLFNQYRSIPLNLQTWELSKNAHSIGVKVSAEDISFDLDDGTRVSKTSGGLWPRGPVVIQVTGTVTVEMPRLVK